MLSWLSNGSLTKLDPTFWYTAKYFDLVIEIHLRTCEHHTPHYLSDRFSLSSIGLAGVTGLEMSKMHPRRSSQGRARHADVIPQASNTSSALFSATIPVLQAVAHLARGRFVPHCNFPGPLQEGTYQERRPGRIADVLADVLDADHPSMDATLPVSI